MKPEIKVTIVYPMDPESVKPDGIQASIMDFIAYAPEHFSLQLIGIACDLPAYGRQARLRVWQRLRSGDRDFDFFPVLSEKDASRRKALPLSLRFTVALFLSRPSVEGRLLFFHRPEPALLFRRSRNPKVAMIHNDIAGQMRHAQSEVLWSRFPRVYFFLEKFVFESLERVYTVTRRSLAFYCSHYPQWHTRFQFLPMWVDTKRFFPSDEAKETLKKKAWVFDGRLSSGKKWILFAGRLQKQKAPQILLETFKLYYQKDPGSCFLVAGAGNARNDMERLAEDFGLEKDVIFLEALPQERLIDFYRASDCLLLASYFEGMPRCVLEALACGLPVVSTDTGEAALMIKGHACGEVVGDVTSRALADALEKVLGSPNQYTRESCARAAAFYAPQRVLSPVYQELERIYQEAATRMRQR